MKTPVQCCGCGHLHMMAGGTYGARRGHLCPCCGPVHPCRNCREKSKQVTVEQTVEHTMAASELEALIVAAQLQREREKVWR